LSQSAGHGEVSLSGDMQRQECRHRVNHVIFRERR
jgi:hypothetical protein